MAVSAPNHFLFVTLWTQGFHPFRRCLWQIMWSNHWGWRLLRFDCLHKSGQNAVFCATEVMDRPAFGKLPRKHFCDGGNNENRWLILLRAPHCYYLNSMLDVCTSGTPHRYKNKATWFGFGHLGPNIIDFTFNARSSSQYNLGTASPERGEGNTGSIPNSV